MAERQNARGTKNKAEPGDGLVPVGAYLVHPERPRGEYAGLPAFFAEPRSAYAADLDRPVELPAQAVVALRARRDAPPRANLPAFMNAYHSSLLMPLAYGAGAGAFWIVCEAPPGPAVSEEPPQRPPPTDSDLAANWLRPLAAALSRLQASGLVHRALRPENLYRSPGSGRILLGPGCVLPPAFLQPVLYEPPSIAVCPPEARGSGLSADDVYALGVLLLELAIGRRPLAGLDDAQILRRKIEFGSFAALAGTERLSQGLVSLLRSMLADDPVSRPTLASLAESGFGAERPKVPRMDTRAPRPLVLAGTQVWSARMLAYAASHQPAEALRILRAGAVDQWLRRTMEQPLQATRIDEALRLGNERGGEAVDPMMLMQTVAVLDPQAPMFWNGSWFWPDAAPSMLAARLAENAPDLLIADAVRHGALRRWATLTGRSATAMVEDIDRRVAKITRIPVPALRMPALTYLMNPFLPCLSPGLAAHAVLQPAQLLAALEALAGAKKIAAGRLLDAQMLAFLAARAGDQEEAPQLPADVDEVLLDLPPLARIQEAMGRAEPEGPRQTYPALAARLLPAARAYLANWPGKDRRERRMGELETAAAAGDLPAMLRIACSDEAREVDQAAFEAARAQAALLRTAHQDSVDAASMRGEIASRVARELVVATGALACIGAVLREALF